MFHNDDGEAPAGWGWAIIGLAMWLIGLVMICSFLYALILREIVR